MWSSVVPGSGHACLCIRSKKSRGFNGSATAPATVTVNTLAAYERGEFFRKELAGNTTANPATLSVSAVATSGTTASGAITMLLPPLNQTLGYDFDGNLTSDGLWVYQYDAENRLTNVTSAAAVPSASKRKLEFAYDYEGKRISKRVSTWTGSAWSVSSYIVYLNDGWRPLVEIDGNTVANPVATVLRTYTWGQDLSGSPEGAGGIGGLVAYQEVQGANTYTHFPIYDGNGNVTGLYSGAGERTAKYEYSPFGEIITKFEASSVKNPFRFSTKYQDTETALVYYGYRYYHPGLGRWINRDPLRERGGLNLFAFVRNRPITARDKLGLTSSTETAAAGGLAAGLGAVGPNYQVFIDKANLVVQEAEVAADATMAFIENDSDAVLALVTRTVENLRGITLAIGRIPDADVAKEIGEATINLKTWNPEISSRIIQGLIDAGNKVYLVSPINAADMWSEREEMSIFGQELMQIFNAAYRYEGTTLLVPP